VSEADGTLMPASFVGTDVTGRFAFFLTPDVRLGNHLPYCDPSKTCLLYRNDTETGEVDMIAAVGGIDSAINQINVAPDGKTVYFPSVTGTVLEAWHEGTVSTVRPMAAALQALVVFMSPNGRYLALRQTTDSNVHVPGDIYLYDAITSKTTCVSCLGGELTNRALMPWEVYKLNNAHAEAVTDDGQVFFSTSSALLPSDTNGTYDVYEYGHGQLALISPGNLPFPAFLAGIAANGRDVFFGTAQGLVPQDTDGQIDFYDARIGGGFASQQRAPLQVCAGEACQPAIASPTTPATASEGASPASWKTHKRGKKRCHKASRKTGKRASRCGHKKKKASQAKRNSGGAR
jgi:hypothetical protein